MPEAPARGEVRNRMRGQMGMGKGCDKGQGCFNGPNRPHPQPGCDDADLDDDGDVDLLDFIVFQDCFNGPNRPAACGE